MRKVAKNCPENTKKMLQRHGGESVRRREMGWKSSQKRNALRARKEKWRKRKRRRGSRRRRRSRRRLEMIV